MKNKEFYKLLKKNQSNSGFTLIELLVGLVMSIFVIGALGFGLMTVLQTNQRENSKVKARTENSRALDFISDEVRRARNIESDTMFDAPGSNIAPEFERSSDRTVVLALDIPEISDSGTMDSDKDDTTTNERIVYYLSSNIGPNWKGPQVLYRWGPQLNANGEYVDDETVLWDSQALIDGINTTPVANPCSTGTVSTVNPTGFYACITGTNTAELSLTGQTKTASGVNDSQTNDTQVVARARTAAANLTDNNRSFNWSVKGLDGALGCKDKKTGEERIWDMRTDFGNNQDDPNDTTKWVQKGFKNRQPQIIPVRTDNNLVVTGSAVNGKDCVNDIWGNPDATGGDDEVVSDYKNKVSHEINFNDPRTFNGDQKDGNYNTTTVASSNPDGRSLEAVQFFKRGGEIPTKYSGYDANNDGDFDDPGDQKSLGKFLYDQGYAIPLGGGDPGDPDTTFKLPISTDERNAAIDANNFLTPAEKEEKKSEIKVLGDDQRIVGMEIGQKYPDQNNDGKSLLNPDGTPGKNPGFDLQDNIFVVTSDVFKTKFESSCFVSGNCNPSTGKPKSAE